jgi:glycosyltransferase involved in cell wall biosynthesis
MHRLSRDALLREELISRGYEQARKFTWEKAARRLLHVYQSMVRG